jgi:hypothetical protein
MVTAPGQGTARVRSQTTPATAQSAPTSPPQRCAVQGDTR